MATQQRSTIDRAGATGGAWRSRPWTAVGVRVICAGVPLASSLVAASFLRGLFDRPSGAGFVAAWFVTIAVASTVVLIAVDATVRRILPLSGLLKLSLSFPDQAPSRFRVALRAGNTRRMAREVERVRAEGLDGDEVDAAERLLALVGYLNVHDRRTRGHSERVRALTVLAGEELGLDPADLHRLQWAALLHDVGKVVVPAEILNKTGRLSGEEFERIKEHPGAGDLLTRPLHSFLGPWALAVGQHHERWDGRGYPSGLAGHEISLAGRIVAVTDAFEVMTSARSYKQPISAAAAREELARCAGSQFDPAVVRAFLQVSIARSRRATGAMTWLGQLPALTGSALASAVPASAAALAAVGILLAPPLLMEADHGREVRATGDVETRVFGDVVDPVSARGGGQGREGEGDEGIERSPWLELRLPDGDTATDPSPAAGDIDADLSPSDDPAVDDLLDFLPFVDPDDIPTTTLPTLTPLPTTLPPVSTTLPPLPVPTTLPALPVSTTVPLPTTLPPVSTTLPPLPTTLPPLPTTLPSL